MNAPWQFSLLGRLSATRGPHTITRFATTRAAALLARLALFPNRSHPREELIDLLWPDSELDAGRLNLRVALASLRRQLEPPDVPTGSVLIADRSAIRLNAPACRTDVADFEAALKTAERAPDARKRRAALEAALTIYAGELLPGFYDDWIVEERQRLHACCENVREQWDGLPGASETVFPGPDAPAEAPAPPVLRGFPMEFTRFFGRETERAEAAGCLRGRQTRLLTLSGPGGSGKTRLAVEIAREVAGDFSGPICFVSLADMTSARFLPDAIADALGLTASATQEPLEQLVTFLSEQPPALLVLDNFEHLVERGAPFVFSLLTRLPALICLVTSRRRLSLPGEREFPVPPLPLPELGGTAAEVSRAASAQLFVDRAQAARPDFQLTPANAASVAELCLKLEGIPLAIELVAVRALSLTPAQMLERLEEHLGRRFELLTSRRGDKTGRHRSLWAAIAWSYDLLPPNLQRFFAGLSVFRGGFTVASAQAVCEEAQTLEFLTQLRERSLIVVEEAGSEMRFRLLETLREFAGDQLDEEQRLSLARRHAAWYLSLAQDAWPQITGPDQARWLDRLEAEHDNLRLALSVWLAAVDGVEEALDMCGSLWRFWSTRGHFASGREWLRRARARPGGAPFIRARADNAAGNLARLQGDYAEAEAAYTDALAIMRELGIQTSVGACLCNLGMVATHREDYAKAQALQEEALALRREIGDQGGVAFTLECLGMVAQHQRDYPLARRLHQESFDLFAELQDDGGQLWTLSNLAAITAEEGDHETAARLFAQALDLCLKLKDYHGLHGLLGNMAALIAKRGDPLRAVTLYGASETLRRRIGAGQAPNDAADLEKLLSEVRPLVSDADFTAAWADGDAMTTDEAVACARGK